jgi:integrase
VSKSTRRSGQIIERGERRFLVRVFLGRDGQGKRQYHNKTIHGTKRDAQTYLNQVLRDRDLGTYVEPTKMLLNAYLDDWLETSAKPGVRPQTLASYKDLLRLYIRPRLGDRALAKLTPLDIQGVYAEMLERGLSPRTVRYTHSVLRSALEQAVKWQLVMHNPADRVDLPRQRREEMQALSPVEVRHFLEVAQGNRFGVLFELLLTTGLRPGEALALRWEDIDLDAGRLRVQRVLIRGRARTEDQDGPNWRFDEPKTPQSRRSVPLPASTARALRTHRVRQLEERLAVGADYVDHGLVFAGQKGAPVPYRNLIRWHFKAVLEAAGLPASIRLYDLRHTCATLLLAAGENPKVVSERLGHASVKLTLDCYSHVLPDMQEAAAARLETLLYGRR